MIHVASPVHDLAAGDWVFLYLCWCLALAPVMFPDALAVLDDYEEGRE